MKLSDKLNRMFHPLMLKYLRHQYNKKLDVYRSKHPTVFKQVPDSVVESHKKLWRPLIGNVKTSWMDMFYGISGNADCRFVPEDVFYGVIERCLNNCNAAGGFIEDKNDVCFYIPKQYQPGCVVRYDRGVWFDGDFNAIDKSQVNMLVKNYGCSMVGKPSMGSCGGSNVSVWKPAEIDLDDIERCFEGYVLQEVLKQEKNVSSFNQSSLNTCRIMTFRRPWSGKTTAIAGMLRLGCGSGIADNLALGGISVDIDSGGHLAEYGVDHDFGKFFEHPMSKKSFKDFMVPYYDKMCKVACEIARKVPGYNLLSFDVVAKENGVPCVIEINATSMTLAQLQTVRPLFGEETEQVVDWCAAHLDFDHFKHFRTWY